MSKRVDVSKHYGVLRKAEDLSFEVLELMKQDKFSNATPEQLKEHTKDYKNRLNNGETLDDIMAEAFASAYRAVQIVYGINLYRVQLMGGYALHHGDVAEMKTGEGKTLTAIAPAYLNALEGKGVHVITVNEYLSGRDSLNTGRVFSILGLTTGSITSEMEKPKKMEEYNKDITYMTNSEVGFDYLRDNLVQSMEEKTQRPLNYAIVDEVDSVLIDEARTPLIISGGSDVTEEDYIKANEIVVKLQEGDYEFDKETNQAYLTPQGATFIEKELNLLNLYSYENSELVHRIHNALQAHFRFEEGVDYAVKDDEIVLIDIFTGRFLEGRQYSNGLNQAIEAKEGIKIKPETKTYASITYQNFFRMYKKLSGMSGTAQAEQEELSAVYNMRVIPIPTNRPVIRDDKPDLVFSTSAVKFEMIVEKVIEVHKTKQPILVGTRSVTDSEFVSKMLTEKGIKHEVLNAKNHAREAEIIARAGEVGAITISTNMAGRGTDIKLGEGVRELGGLFVIGSERHESRRIDDQLRGRAGRQGDVGTSQFLVSLEDEIMQRAGLQKVKKFMGSLDRNPIESKLVSKALTNAQKKLEGLNYDSRKSVIEYDDVLNQQRLLTYKQRDLVLTSEKMDEITKSMIEGFIESIANDKHSYVGGVFKSENFISLLNFNIDGINLPIKEVSREEAVEFVKSKLLKVFEDSIKDEDHKELNERLKSIMIYAIDSSWQDQIERLSRLKVGIRYRQYAQKNPVQAYVLEADKMFDFYRDEIKKKVSLINIRNIFKKETIELFSNEVNRDTQEILIK